MLRRLAAPFGRARFTAGLRQYFSRHAGQNTTLRDLLGHLGQASGRDLQTWSRLWLETAGVNTLSLEVLADNQGIITAAAITQTAVEAFPTLRPHTLAIGSYAVQGDQPARVNRIAVHLEGGRTQLPQLVGPQRPAPPLVNAAPRPSARAPPTQRSLPAHHPPLPPYPTLPLSSLVSRQTSSVFLSPTRNKPGSFSLWF